MEVHIYNSSLTFTISDSDHPMIEPYRWVIHKAKGITYVKARINGNYVYLHRFIMKVKKGYDVVHKDGNGLNNERDNLQVVSHNKIMESARKRKPKTPFKGVRYSRGWYVSIAYMGVRHTVGPYDDDVSAAKDYDRLALFFYGVDDSTYLNFPAHKDMYMEDLNEYVKNLLPYLNTTEVPVQWHSIMEKYNPMDNTSVTQQIPKESM